MDYKIIATLGPSSSAEAMWTAMLSAGASGFRLNTSHLSLDQLATWLDRLLAFRTSIDGKFPVILDLQGSKWRLGHFSSFELLPGQEVRLVFSASTDQKDRLPVPHADFFEAAQESGEELVLNDARIRLQVESMSHDSLNARVLQGGEISAAKGITFTASKYRKESLSEKDQAIFGQTRQLDFIAYALSYVRDADEMARYRLLLGNSAYLIAKIERRPAVEEAGQIAAYADELWLCRGDLGAELGLRAMAEAVQQFSSLPSSLSIPILMAGQVLEHMSGHADPTRSEVCYLYDSLALGYRGFVLSDETAIGKYPLESCWAAAMFKG